MVVGTRFVEIDALAFAACTVAIFFCLTNLYKELNVLADSRGNGFADKLPIHSDNAEEEA